MQGVQPTWTLWLSWMAPTAFTHGTKCRIFLATFSANFSLTQSRSKWVLFAFSLFLVVLLRFKNHWELGAVYLNLSGKRESIFGPLKLCEMALLVRKKFLVQLSFQSLSRSFCFSFMIIFLALLRTSSGFSEFFVQIESSKELRKRYFPHQQNIRSLVATFLNNRFYSTLQTFMSCSPLPQMHSR